MYIASPLSQAEVTPGVLELPGVTGDPKGAVEGEADCIVSGDKDLLVFESYAGAKVVAPHRFLRTLRVADSVWGAILRGYSGRSANR
jgi:hypothetical protein